MKYQWAGFRASGTFFFPSLFAVWAALWGASSAWSAEWIRAQVQSSVGGFVYPKPDKQSEPVGYYAPGTRLSVYGKPRNGFYAIYFQQPWHNAQYFWVPEAVLTFVLSDLPAQVQADSDSFPGPVPSSSAQNESSLWFPSSSPSLSDRMTPLTPVEKGVQPQTEHLSDSFPGPVFPRSVQNESSLGFPSPSTLPSHKTTVLKPAEKEAQSQAELLFQRARRQWRMQLKAGWSQLRFKQTYLPSFTIWNPSVQLNLRQELASRWQLESQIFYLFALQKDLRSQQSLQLFSADLQAGYQWVGARFALIGLAGWSYGTSFSRPSGFGYPLIQGPRATLRAGYSLTHGAQVSGWIGLTSFNNGNSRFFSLGSRNMELKWGVSYLSASAANRGKGVGLFLDIKQVRLKQQSDEIHVKTYTLGMSYAF